MAENSAANKKGSVTTAGSKKRKRKSAVKYWYVYYRYPQGWIIHSDRSYRPRSIHVTQREAVEVARGLAKKAEVTLVIHHRNNWVKKWEHYNREPLPPPKPPKVRSPGPPRTAIRKAIRRAILAAIDERRLASEQQVKSQPSRQRKHTTTSKAN
jgi:hypothetical protein